MSADTIPTVLTVFAFCLLTFPIFIWGFLAMEKENDQLAERLRARNINLLRLSTRINELQHKLEKFSSDRWHLCISAGRAMQVLEDVQKNGGGQPTHELLTRVEGALASLYAVEKRVLNKDFRA